MDNTLISRCMVAYSDAAPNHLCNRDGIRAVIEHLAAELVVAGHLNAAGWLLNQVQAQVIELRPDRGGAA